MADQTPDPEKKTGISDERFNEIFEAINLSEDLRKGIGKIEKQIEEALYAKLEYAPIAGIGDFLDSLKSETKDTLLSLIKSALSSTDFNEFSETKSPDRRKALIQLALDKVKQHSATNSLLVNALAAARSVDKCIEEFNEKNEEDLEEFSEKLLQAVSDLNKLRVTHDVIPLLQRGLYATDVSEALRYWKDNLDDEKIANDEGCWQKELVKRIAVLQRALGGKIVLINAQAHVGSEGLNGKGDRITDFLLQHSDTKNIILVEIKTPGTPLLGISYRNTFALSENLSGSISQVLLQRHDAMVNYYSKRVNSEMDFNVAAPRCIILAGRLDKEIGSDDQKRRAFEMQRQAIESNVRIITFDELYKDFSNFHLLD